MDIGKLSKTQKTAIDYFKQRESNFQLYHLESFGVKKVCAAWPNVHLTFIPDDEKPPRRINYKWSWVWRGVQFDPVELSRLTGLREQVLFALDIAIGNKLIYPDGSVNKKIQNFLEIPYSDSDTLLKGLIEKDK